MVKENFDFLMEEYKKLPLTQKKEELLKKNKEVISMMILLSELYNKNVHPLYNREINDIKEQPYSDDDLLEAMYAYTYILEDLIVQFLDTNK